MIVENDLVMPVLQLGPDGLVRNLMAHEECWMQRLASQLAPALAVQLEEQRPAIDDELVAGIVSRIAQVVR